MDHGTRDDLTALLEAARAGGEDTKDRLVRAAYGELRRMAAGFMRRERTDHTLQPSALVNEAVIRLLDGGALVKAQDRRHLFAAAAQAMRQALVDHARTRGAAKRAGGRGRGGEIRCQFIISGGEIRCQFIISGGKSGVSSSFRGEIRCQFIISQE